MGRSRIALVIDDDPASRAELEATLQSVPVTVVAACGYGHEAQAVAEELQPELIFAAINEPVDAALTALRSVRQLLPATQIIAYSSISDVDLLRRAMRLGIQDVLPWPLTRADIDTALNSFEPANVDHIARYRPRRAAGTILTIFGAKGGIGKSTIATNMAAVMAQSEDLSVLLMDMDTRFGDIAIMLDVKPKQTVADLAALGEDLDRDAFLAAITAHESGVQVLAAPKHPSEWRNVSAEQMKTVIEFAAGIFDYVILDTPGTFNDIVATAIDVATRVLVISSLDMASIKDTAYMLDLLDAENFPAEKLLLVINDVNRVHSLRTGDIPKLVRHEVFWDIAYDKHVLLSTEAGQPVVITKPKSRAAKQMRGLTEKILGTSARATSRRSRGSLFSFLRRALLLRTAAVL